MQHAHHDHNDTTAHGHTHGAIDASITTTQKGIWAVKWSFVGLFVTALLQLFVVFLSGSVALLADSIHNFGDAATAMPLWIAFLLGKKKPSKRFTYGYGKVEDVAGVTIVVIMILTTILSAYETIQRFFHPHQVIYLWAVCLASLIGFVGNEAVAVFRIKTGKEMNSAALVADGYHARADGFTSLAVLFGAIGVGLGFPLADPLIGLFITIAIVQMIWQAGKSVFSRLLDGIDPKIISDIQHRVSHTKGVLEVTETRVRWLGHQLQAELNIAVDAKLSVEKGHAIANQVHHDLLHELPYLSFVTIHVDPSHSSGEKHHHA